MMTPLLGSRSCPAALPDEEAHDNNVAWKASTSIAEGHRGAGIDILIVRNA